MVPGIVTALLLVLFIVGTVWIYNPRRKREFEALGSMPLSDDDDAPANESNRTKEQEESTR